MVVYRYSGDKRVCSLRAAILDDSEWTVGRRDVDRIKQGKCFVHGSSLQGRVGVVEARALHGDVIFDVEIAIALDQLRVVYRY